MVVEAKECEGGAVMGGSAKSSIYESKRAPALLPNPPIPFLRQPTAGSSPPDLAVFQQPWWLEIAKRGEDYREFVVRKCGKIVGSLGFVVATNQIGNKLGFPPIWAHLGGPVLDQGLNRIERAEALRRLVVQFPRSISFKFVCNPGANDADLVRQAFQRAGFEHHTEMTYVQQSSHPDIMSRLSSRHRGHLRRAIRDLDVLQMDADEFIEFYQSNLKAAGKQSYASLENARDLIAKGLESDTQQVRVLGARPRLEGSTFDAAIACAWDDRRYYLWLLTRRRSVHSNDRRPHGDAVKLLILRATQHSQELNLTFDVDGATTEGARNLYDDILKFPLVESRDVFIRDTKLFRLYKQLQSKSRAQSARLRK
jgi:hypothetical protein